MEVLKQREKRILPRKLAKKLIIALLVVIIFDFFLFPAPVLAGEIAEEVQLEAELALIEKNTPNIEIINNLPPTSDLEVDWSGYYTITAYNSDVGQTDGDPCTTANGFNLCEHGIEDSIAANFLKFGTKVKIPDLFGDRVFVVRDRMNKRYQNRVDVWMLDKSMAKKFGVKIAKIEVLDEH